MSTVNSITITDTSNISVVTAGTQGVAGPNTILGRSVATSTAGTSGSLLVYDHANTQWEDSQSTRSQSLTAKLYNLQFTSGGASVTQIYDEDNMGSNSNTGLATQQSIKSYVDVQNAAQAVNFQGDTGGAQSVTINSETLTIAGGTGLASVGSSNAVTISIDSTVATLTGTQTLTNKTLTSPVINTGDINNPDLDGGTITGSAIDNSIIGANTAAAITGTTITGTAITGTSFVIGSADINEAELEILDGATLSTTEINYLDGTTLGTVVASKVLAVDSDKDITGFRNITLTGELDAASLDVSGNADIDGTLEADAITVDGTALDEFISDTVGAMVSSNAESGITVAYQDSDNTLDFDVADFTITLAGDLGGSVTITDLASGTLTATIQANSVALGTDTTGNYVADLTAGEGIDVSGGGSETATITISAEDATDSNKGIASFDATDFSVSSGAVTLQTERIQDLVGAMVSSNTESGIAVTYEDSDGTLDFNVSDPVITLSGDVAGSATMTNLGDVTITTTIQANSIALGTDTTGNYVADLTAGEGIDVSGGGSENATITVSVEDATETNKGIATFDGTDFTVSSGDVTLNAERVQDIVGAMVSSNTESGIAVTYEDGDGTLDFNVADPTLTFTGDVTGSGTMTNLGNTSIALTVAADSVALGTDTTGNYVATIADAGNSHITVANSGSENAAITLNITDDAIGTDQIANNAVALGTQSTGNYIATIAGTSNEITVSGSGSETAAVTISLPDDVTIGNDLTVTGDLTVNGDTVTLNTSTLTVEDLTIRVGKGATTLANTDGAGLEFGASSGKPTITWDNGNSRLSSNKTFYAASLVGALTGNSTTATALETARTIHGVSFDGSANIDLSEVISDTVGAMFSSNTETGITATYQDSDNTIDLVIGTLNQDTTGNSATATALETARTIHGVSFDGTANIDLSEVVQDTVGAMFGSNTETGITATYEDGDGTIDLVIGSGDITNAMLAGSIANAKLANSAITVSDGSNTTAIALGGTITYTAGEGVDITESSGTLTIAGEDATSSNKGIASFGSDFSVSSGAVALSNSGASAGSYGTATAIPAVTVDAKGRITSISTNNISTSFTLSADSGSNDTFATGGTLTFTGGEGIDTTVSDDTITIAAELATETNAGVATFDGTDFSVSSGDVTINVERIADIIGGMVGSNTETGITVTYQDSDNTLDFVIGTLNQDTTGNAATATALATARTIGGTSFDGTSNIAVALSTEATNITASANNSTDETVYLTFVDGATGTQGIETDTGLTYNPSSGDLTIGGELVAATLDISGNVDIDGTLETDALTINGTTLSETIADTVGAMVGSNTETGITVSYDDSDNTLDFVIATLNQDTSGTAALATSITVSANNSTDETVYPVFVDGATGTQGAETDTGLTYNPSTGLLTSTGFSGNLTGTLQTAAQTNVTSLGTLTSLAITNDLTVNTNVLKVDTTNNRVGVKTASPSYTLDVGTATDGILIAKGTTAQRPTGAAGVFRYNTTLGRFEGYTDAWGEIGGGGTNTFSVDNYTTANNSTTAFTLSQTPNSEDNLFVFVGGVFQNPNDYTLNGTTLTLDEAPPSGTRIIVYSVRAAVSGSNLNNDQFTCNGSTTAFTLTIAPVDEKNTQVFLDGVYQQKTDYAVSGTTLTMDTAPANGAILEVNTFTQTDINVPVDDTITTAKLVDLNVTTGKIAADAITGAKLADNAVDSEHYTDGSIDAAHLNANVISGLTEVTPVSGDKMMILDATDSALKKADVDDIMATAVSITSAADAVALTFDSSENATFAGNIVKGNLTISGTEIDLSSGDLTVDVAGDITLDADGGDIWFKDGGTAIGQFRHASSSFIIKSNVTDNDLILRGDDNGSAVDALTLDMSEAGAATFNAGITATSATFTDDVAINNGSPELYFGTTGNHYNWRIAAQENVDAAFTIDVGAQDTAYGDDTYNTLLTVKNGGNVGIGTTSPAASLHINTSTNSPMLVESTHGDGGYIELQLSDSGGAGSLTGYIGDSQALIASGTAADLAIRAQANFVVSTGGSTERFKIDTVGDAKLSGAGTALTQTLFADSGSSEGSANITFNTDGASTDQSVANIKMQQGSGDGGSRKGEILFQVSDNGAPATAMTIANNGNVGISTSSPQEKLHVYHGSSTASIRVSGEGNNNRACEIGYDASDGPYIRAFSSGISSLKFFTDNTGHRMTIDGSGNIGAPTGTNIYNASDERLKKNITSLDNSLETIKNLNPVKFNWIDNFSESENDKTLYGFVAQEVQKVSPDIVESFGDGSSVKVDDKVIENPLTVREKFLVPMLVKAIQELEARIKTLEDA